MKKILSIFLLLIVTNCIQAQQQSLSKTVKQDLEVLLKSKLNLDEIQVRRITSVLVGEEANQERNKAALVNDKKVFEARMKELHVMKINNVKGALTPEQVKIFNSSNLESKLN